MGLRLSQLCVGLSSVETAWSGPAWSEIASRATSDPVVRRAVASPACADRTAPAARAASVALARVAAARARLADFGRRGRPAALRRTQSPARTCTATTGAMIRLAMTTVARAATPPASRDDPSGVDFTAAVDTAIGATLAPCGSDSRHAPKRRRAGQQDNKEGSVHVSLVVMGSGRLLGGAGRRC
jgi:hypothetical protein